MRVPLLALLAVIMIGAARPAAGAALGFDFKTTPCRFTGAFDLPQLDRPCDPAPRNATTGEFYNFAISADEKEACCPVTATAWYWVAVDKTNWLGATRPTGGAPGPAPGPTAEAAYILDTVVIGEAASGLPAAAPAGGPAADLPAAVVAAGSDPFNADGGRANSTSGARSLAAAAGVAAAVVAALL